MFDERVDMTGTGSVKWELAEKLFNVEGLTPMWVADMDFRGPQAVIEALKWRAELGVFGYTMQPDFLYQAVVGWLDRRHGWRTETEWICFSPGVVTALKVSVLAFTEPGDRVIIQPPVYPPFFKVVKESGRELVYNPLRLTGDGKYEMDFDDLRQKVAGAKMLILCSPHNPVGRVWSEVELKNLAEICEKYELIVVSDEIHSDLILKPHRHRPLLQVAPHLADRSVVCVAPSKTFNMAGMATSFIFIPNPDLRGKFKAVMEKDHHPVINPFSLIAADAAYRHGDAWLDQVLEYIKGNVEYLDEYVRRHLPSIRVIKPEGTYLVWLDCRGLGLAPKELQDFMLGRAKVALNAGDSFGKEGEGFMRMNVAAPRAVLEEALRKIGSAVESLAATKKGE
jgi:cystathionine beta-lyase